MIGYQAIKCHKLYDVCMGFQRQAWFVAGSHKTEALNSTTYYSVVYRDSIPIGFLYESLHGVDINAIDMDNAYVYPPCTRMIWFLYGYEIRFNEVHIILVVHIL